MDPCCDVEERLDQVPLLGRIASHRVPTIFKRFHVVAAGPRDMGRDTRSAHSISPADARPPQIQTTADNPGAPSTTSRNAVGRSELFSSESPRQLSIAPFCCAEVRLLRINTCRGPSAVCVFLRFARSLLGHATNFRPLLTWPHEALKSVVVSSC
jgi:hypothetical protein